MLLDVPAPVPAPAPAGRDERSRAASAAGGGMRAGQNYSSWEREEKSSGKRVRKAVEKGKKKLCEVRLHVCAPRTFLRCVERAAGVSKPILHSLRVGEEGGDEARRQTRGGGNVFARL
jgi:hypothetical protein